MLCRSHRLHKRKTVLPDGFFSKNKITMKKNQVKAGSRTRRVFLRLYLLVWSVLMTFPLWAQGDGITEATAMVRGYLGPGGRLIYAIGAIVGLIGATKVYSKFTSGDPDTAKTAAAWFGACIFLVVCATVLRSFFGNAPSVGL